MSSSRPSFVNDELLSRPLPELTPPKLSPTQNPVYSEAVRSKIADLKCHPALESALHLMNDDLFAAHFLLRKMQEDEWGKWLHATLHLAEGDLSQNAKLWYEQVDPSVLSKYWGSSDPVKASTSYVASVVECHQQRNKPHKDENKEREAREVKWKELVKIMEELEGMHGWEETDGLKHYTKDDDPSHKSNVLGEGWRPNQRFGT